MSSGIMSILQNVTTLRESPYGTCGAARATGAPTRGAPTACTRGAGAAQFLVPTFRSGTWKLGTGAIFTIYYAALFMVLGEGLSVRARAGSDVFGRRSGGANVSEKK